MGDAVAAHRTFVAERLHPVEVRASERAQLVQWLSGRLGRPLVIPDLSLAGLRFMGGRQQPPAQGPAALLMYDGDAGTRITLYLRVDFEGGFGYAVTGRADRARLQRVAEAVHRQIEAGPASRGTLAARGGGDRTGPGLPVPGRSRGRPREAPEAGWRGTEPPLAPGHHATARRECRRRWLRGPGGRAASRHPRPARPAAGRLAAEGSNPQGRGGGSRGPAFTRPPPGGRPVGPPPARSRPAASGRP